jgi:hypothetical protein
VGAGEGHGVGLGVGLGVGYLQKKLKICKNLEFIEVDEGRNLAGNKEI